MSSASCARGIASAVAMVHWSTKLTAGGPWSFASPSLATLGASMALLRPIASRVVALVPVVLGITVLVFALNAVALGEPFREQRPVGEVIRERLPATARLALAATLISVVLGVGIGALAAVRAGSALDHLLMAVAVLGISTPVFWLGLMLQLVFAVRLGWLPVSGYGAGAPPHLILPAVALGALHTGTVARMTRSSLLEVVRQDFMAAARAKGLSEWTVLGKHALRNALVPVVTVIGIGLADLLVGAPLTETVFAWPGVGRLLVAAVGQRDVPVVMGAVLVFALVYVLGNLLVDLAYLVIDPRIRDAARA